MVMCLPCHVTVWCTWAGCLAVTSKPSGRLVGGDVTGRSRVPVGHMTVTCPSRSHDDDGFI
jgi:hypothetical protein